MRVHDWVMIRTVLRLAEMGGRHWLTRPAAPSPMAAITLSLRSHHRRTKPQAANHTALTNTPQQLTRFLLVNF